MATKKDKIEALEKELGEVQDGMQRLEMTISKLVESMNSTQGSSSTFRPTESRILMKHSQESNTGNLNNYP